MLEQSIRTLQIEHCDKQDSVWRGGCLKRGRAQGGCAQEVIEGGEGWSSGGGSAQGGCSRGEC